MQNFVEDKSIQFIPLEPMSKAQRRQVHLLATLYNLKSASSGSGKRRFSTLQKTPKSYVPNQQVINNLFRDFGINPNGKESEHIKNEMALAAATPKETSVGHNAPPIADSNLGKKMLLMMGWSEGSGLGVTHTGILEPIKTEIKNNRKGLGLQ